MKEKFEVAPGVYYSVFTPDETGCPELHEGPWHFEPVTDYEDCGEAFSEGYATREEAKEAAIRFYCLNSL